VAELSGVSQTYTRQLFKAYTVFDKRTLAETKVPPSTVIAVAYAPEPARWLKPVEAEKLTEQDVWRKVRAEKRGVEEAPDGPSEQTVYARCRTCGNAGWHERLTVPMLTDLLTDSAAAAG
jgi:hypothetical protein